VESHGGYLCRVDSVELDALAVLAAKALRAEQVADPKDVALLVSAIPDRKILRLAYDAPFTYGRLGARWYGAHQHLAQLASEALGTQVHAYVLDAEEFEEVTTYGGGRRVGGDRLRYEDAELPEDLDDDDAFERMKDRWPLGHLAYIFGISRAELVRLPRAAPSTLLDLAAVGTEDPRWALDWARATG
jgi:hypothetical protein